MDLKSLLNTAREDVQKGYARRAFAKISYNGTDITAPLQPYSKVVEYSDAISGEADDLQITLKDTDGLWLTDWFPDKGATLTASIVTEYWDSPTAPEKELPCGQFEIDEIECSSTPSEVKIKAVSVPDNTTLRGTEHTQAWEKLSIWRVANDIAWRNGMGLQWDVKDNPNIDRIEQTEQSDLSFLNKLCQDHGYSLKVVDNTLVVFDLKDLEAAEPLILIKRPEVKDLASQVAVVTDSATTPALKTLVPAQWNFRTQTRDVYKTCIVEYADTKTKQTIKAQFDDPNKKVGKVLRVKKEVKSQAEADELARRELRAKNLEEVTAKLDLMGDTDLSSGLTCQVTGFGHFDGKYIISAVHHSVSSGYNCSVDLRRCLIGY